MLVSLLFPLGPLCLNLQFLHFLKLLQLILQILLELSKHSFFDFGVKLSFNLLQHLGIRYDLIHHFLN